jgi:hypothetical protein
MSDVSPTGQLEPGFSLCSKFRTLYRTVELAGSERLKKSHSYFCCVYRRC